MKQANKVGLILMLWGIVLLIIVVNLYSGFIAGILIVLGSFLLAESD